MGFFDKIKDIVSASDEDEGYEEMENTSNTKESATTNDYYSSSTGRSYEKEKTTQFPSDRKNKNNTVSRVNSQLQVALVKPERFEDVPQIADHLADGRTVVLNLEAANRETQRRLLDFLSGTAFAHGGRDGAWRTFRGEAAWRVAAKGGNDGVCGVAGVCGGVDAVCKVKA